MKGRTIAITLMTILALSTTALSGCAGSGVDEAASSQTYRTVTAEEARNLMETESDYIILDVRTQEEYDSGHIPDAVLLPSTEVAEQAKTVLPDPDQLILVYCRSGNRSAQAASVLAGLGYTNVVDFGGLNNWPYEVE